MIIQTQKVHQRTDKNSATPQLRILRRGGTNSSRGRFTKTPFAMLFNLLLPRWTSLWEHTWTNHECEILISRSFSNSLEPTICKQKNNRTLPSNYGAQSSRVIVSQPNHFDKSASWTCGQNTTLLTPARAGLWRYSAQDSKQDYHSM